MKGIVVSGWLAAGVAGRSAAAGRTMHWVKRLHPSDLGKGVWLRLTLVLTDAFPTRIRGQPNSPADGNGSQPLRLRAPSFLRLRLLAQLTHYNFL
jgi:hypothetical protein